MLDHKDYRAFSKRIGVSKRVAVLCLLLPPQHTTLEEFRGHIADLHAGKGMYGVAAPDQILPLYVIEC